MCRWQLQLPKEKKVPKIEKPFLLDQRSHRKMVIAGVDAEVTRKIANREERKKQLDQQTRSGDQLNCPLPVQRRTEHRNETEVNNLNRLSYNTVALPNVSQIADRYNVSNSAAAAIATATLIDFNIVSEDNPLAVIDADKMTRHRNKGRQSQTVEHESQISNRSCNALYFDSRIDLTKNYVDGSLKIEKEDHYSMLEEPHSQFLGFITIEEVMEEEKDGKRKAQIVHEAINDFLEKNNIKLDDLKLLGADGTVLNTGHVSGIIRRFEVNVNRPLQWAICMLHCLELPLQHLILAVNGITKSPTGFSGVIGQQLGSCENLKIVKFKRLSFKCEVPNLEDVANKFSSDQKYLHDICCAISSGEFSEQLANRSPGKLNHARWLTTANRILRLYVSTSKPS